MPSLELPLLEIDTGKISQLNPRNVESLFGLWTVFSRCSGSIEGGKRYENMSWRLWNRETFCCPPQPQLAITPAIDVPLSRPSAKEIPVLSASVDSADSDKSVVATCAATSTPQDIPQHRSTSEDSALSRSRGKEKHFTTVGLEKMVASIQEMTELKPLSSEMEASLPKLIARPAPEEDAHRQTSTEPALSSTTLHTDTTTRQSDHRGSDTSVSSDGLIRSGSAVYGFSPSQLPASFRAKSRLGSRELPLSSSKPLAQLAPKKPNMFSLGASSGEDESSFEDRMSFKPQRSSLSESLKTSRPLQNQKKASFRDIVEARQQVIKENSDQDEDAIASSDEEDITDSAIEDDEDDDEGWEDDDVSVEGKPPPEDSSLFKRVDSRPELVSRRSMLTFRLQNNPDHQRPLSNLNSKSTSAIHPSQSSSPKGPSLGASPSEEDDPHDDDDDEEEVPTGLTMKTAGNSRPMPIIQTTSNTHPSAHSPRTTRRNMLATELTESLRRNLLWERQQKSTTANAVFKRRHTAQNMANLQNYPEPTPGQALQDASKNNSWNHYFDAPWEYHTKGW